MKTMILAAAAVLSIGVGSAFAQGDSPSDESLTYRLAPRAAVVTAPGTNSTGVVVHTYSTQVRGSTMTQDNLMGGGG